MALFRALESVRPASQRLVADPFAPSFLSPRLQRAVRLSRISCIRFLVERYADRRLPGARTSGIARTLLIDEAWTRALSDGIHQVAILGAGFDCRAYRLPDAACATIFEVDHPAMLAVKEARLKQILPAIPPNVRFAAIDFNRQRLPEVLANAGFDPSLPALFLWEGVTNYLTEDAVDSVLRYVGDCAPGSRIVFTYVHKGALDGFVEFEGAARIRRDVVKLGEPWTFGLVPKALPDFLGKRNLKLDFDAGASEYRLRCYGPRAARMKGYDFYHVAIAHVPERDFLQ